MDELTMVEQNVPVIEGEVVLPNYGKKLSLNTLTNKVELRGIINQICQYIDIASVVHKIEKGTEYIVHIPTEFQAGFEHGTYWIMESAKTGKLWPSLMEVGKDGRNHIVTPLPIKKRDAIQGNPVKEITNHYQNLYLQQQMNELSGLIESTLDTVKRIEQGQNADRIARLNAGRQGVILALTQKDDSTRASAMLLAIHDLNYAQNQFLETLKNKVNAFEPLPKSKVIQLFRALLKNGYLDAKDDEYGEIEEYFKLYIQATQMLSGAYIAIGDSENAQKVFDMSIKEIDAINFRKLKTIEYSHKEMSFDKIYDNTTRFILTEGQTYLDMAQDFDCLSITLTGDDLLEVISDVRECTI